MIWFWCDSRAAIGLGHVVRCLALAQWATRRGDACRFVVPDMWGGLQRFVSHFDYDFEVADRLVGPIGANDIVVVDGYEFDVAQVPAACAKTVLIDDLGERDVEVDVLVNPNVYAPSLTYDAAGRVLLGSEYTLLRPEFVDAREARPPMKRNVERVFVMLGGVDPTGETDRVLSALAVSGFRGRVDLVTARQDLTARAEGFELVVHRSISSPAALMREADIAVCAAGGSTWELACIGLPAIQIVVADNQRKIGEWLRENHAALVLDSPADHEALTRGLASLQDIDVRERFAHAGRALIDGRGATRVLDALQS